MYHTIYAALVGAAGLTGIGLAAWPSLTNRLRQYRARRNAR